MALPLSGSTPFSHAVLALEWWGLEAMPPFVEVSEALAGHVLLLLQELAEALAEGRPPEESDSSWESMSSAPKLSE